jgi:hypothetical protein
MAPKCQGIKFIPLLAVKSLGGLHELSVAKIWKLTPPWQTVQGEKESRSNLLQPSRTLLVRGNCALFVKCITEIVPADMDDQE